MRRTATEIYNYSRAAGLSVAASIIAVAVALGESSGDDTARGDVGLQTSTWGPSVGIWQIRTLKAETGSGSDRDINALMGNPARQAQAMAAISRQGADWSPWTVFNKGIYEKYLGQAQEAAKGTGAAVQPVTLPTGVPSPDGILESAKGTLWQLTAAGLGVVLVGVGMMLAISPTTVATLKKGIGL
jgi:hypothetical protein